ncbi:pirin family protein [Leptolyngbyaceae cyanobacterium CCMR0082]|uniref:Pirin family protein n=2 Tax=Adonisia turfae TaxID=2950184 RepID=A0A6M0SDT6_9CYAN|nr:pirin family protein [Adonisia turfae]NEZ58425.1 pirin family protein [Adonisia turfae CCMR0081]NEZ65842.1 pirin family protein [Adonisia turfae CCMR0082]
MMTVRPASERGNANFGWLDSRHTFSFGSYYDPAHMGFGTLRVINEDKVAPGRGFPTHSHRDMEIISYVVDGALEHKDSIGNGSIIRPGDVQRMSAGSGISHSEYNASKESPVHFLQIWVLPDKQGIEPGYEQTYFSPEEKQGRLRLVGSQDGRDGSITIHQDMNLYAAQLGLNEQVDYTLQGNRLAWVQVVRGQINLNKNLLSAGDGAAISASEAVSIAGQTDDTEILLFDMAA